MNINCPNCHLTGEVNTLDGQVEGFYMDCPRCDTSFRVGRNARVWGPDTMNCCPSCNFSTFSEEAFDVCPRCGLNGKEFNDRMRKQHEVEQRSWKTEFTDLKGTPMGSQQIRLIGSIALAVSVLLLFYGIWGVMTQSVTGIQMRMAELSVDPDSRLKIFVDNLLPFWLWIVYGGFAAYVSYRFLQLDAEAPALLEKTAWTGMGLVVASRFAVYIATIVNATTPLFFITEFVSMLLQAIIWSAPVALLIWALRQPQITSEFSRRQT